MSVHGFYAALGVDLPGRAGELPVRCFANPDAHAHDDRRPSASVNGATGLWHCHACGVGGSPYDAALALGVSPAEAMQALEDHGLREPSNGPNRTGARWPSVRRSESSHASEVSRPSTVEVEALHRRLLDNDAALERVRELRGWTRPTLEALGLGFDGQRVTFPVRDAAGELVSLLRYLPGERPNGAPKMLAPKGCPRELYPAPESVDGDVLWLVEGEPDAVAGHELGLPAVGVPGTGKWAPEWGERFAGRDVVISFDCDVAGRRAAATAAEALAAHAARVRVVDLEGNRDDGYDLGDLVREAAANGGVGHARELLEQVAEWAEPVETSAQRVDVDADELLDELVGFIRRYVAMSAAQADVVALWIVHTHALDAAEATPYLAVTSAEKRSGKSRLLEVVALLVARPLSTMNVSDAALFRSLAEPPPTVLFDEVDAVYGAKARDREDQRGMINAGYRRGASVLRCVGDGAKQRVEPFPVFAAKALAGIGELPDTVADRAIPIRLERRGPQEQVARFRVREVEPVAEALRAAVTTFADKSIDALAAARPDLPDELDDRAQDVAEPLLAVADLAGGGWPRRARRALVELRNGATVEDESIGVRLLADVRDQFGGRDRISSSDLLDALAAIDEAPWGDWYGKPLSSRTLARLLKPYGIRSRSVRLDDGTTPKGFTREQFESAFSRYLPPDTPSIRHTATTRTTSGIEANRYPPQNPLVADTKSGANPHHERDVADVADTERGEGGEA